MLYLCKGAMMGPLRRCCRHLSAPIDPQAKILMLLGEVVRFRKQIILSDEALSREERLRRAGHEVNAWRIAKAQIIREFEAAVDKQAVHDAIIRRMGSRAVWTVECALANGEPLTFDYMRISALRQNHELLLTELVRTGALVEKNGQWILPAANETKDCTGALSPTDANK